MHRARHSLDQLTDLSSAESGDRRIDILNCITDLFLITLEQQQDSDTDIFGDVMEHVAYDLDIPVRAELSERIAEASPAPHKLIVRLANDAIEVAGPVLQHSPCLREEDLIAIMRSRSRNHVSAIVKRPFLSEAVTDVIVEASSEKIVAEMVQNSGAKFSSNGYERLAEFATSTASVLAPLLARDDVPDTVMTCIRSDVAEKSAADASEKRPGEPGARTNGKSSASRGRPAADEAMLVQFAKSGEAKATVRCLSVLTDLDAALVKNFLFEADLSALIVICKSHRFGRSTFASLFHLRQASNRHDPVNFASAMRRYHAMEVRSAETFFRMLKDQRSSDTEDQAETPEMHDNPD